MLPRQFTKLAFFLLYNHLAWTYDLVAWSVSFGQWAAWRRLAMQFLQPGPVLELAYGTGGLFIDLEQAGHRPVGIDASPYMARLAGNRLRRQGRSVRLSRAQAQYLPFPPNYFANIVATFPTDYIFDPDTVSEIARVLQSPHNGRPPGKLIVVLEGQLRGPWPIRPFIDWLYKITNQRDFPSIKPLPLFAEFNLKAEWHLFEHNGVAARMLIAEKQ